MKKLVFLSLTLLLTSTYAANKPKPPKPDIEVRAKLNNGLSSEYFGFVAFEIENNTGDWEHVTDVDIEFFNPAQEKMTRIVSGKQLQAWNEAKLSSRGFWLGAALDSVDSSGGNGSSPRNLPQSHLLSGDFYVPPQMSAKKWVLFNTKHDENSPILKNIKLVLKTDGEKPHVINVTLTNYSGEGITPRWQSLVWKKMKEDKKFPKKSPQGY